MYIYIRIQKVKIFAFIKVYIYNTIHEKSHKYILSKNKYSFAQIIQIKKPLRW